jgi:hypothetical protein
VTVFGELRVPPALQNLHHRLLDHAIQHRRDAQLTHPAVRLGYLYPPHRLRFVSPCKKLFADGCPVLLQVSRQRLDRHAVDARTSLVGLHSLESLHTVVVRQTSSISCCCIARLSDTRFAVSVSDPPQGTIGVSLRPSSPKASRSWVFCRFLPFGPSPLARLLCPPLTPAARSEWIAPHSVPIPGHAADLPR